MNFFFFAMKIMAVVCGLHYLLSLSIIKFFIVSDLSARRTITWILFFLSVSFLPAAVLLRFFHDSLSRIFYMAAATWLGLFIYLLLATCLCWLVFGIGRLFFVAAPNMRLIAIFAFGIALLVSLHGIWRAQHPEIKSIAITLNGLPAAWHGKKIVQLSDVHLGSINGAGFMQRIADQVNRLEPDLILITGDLFDGMNGELKSVIASLNRLKAAKGVYFVTGNHEGYLGLLRPLSILRKTHIRVLHNEIVNLDGLQIIGISYPDYRLRNNARELLSSAGGYDADKPGILMYHTPTDIAEFHADRGSQQTKTYWRPDTGMALAKEAKIDLQLSGHTHRGQLFPFDLLTRQIYKGYDYGLHRDGDFQIYITSGTGTWGPPMRVGTSSEIVVLTLK